MSDDTGSKTVLAGPEFGIARVMRPYRDFETQYQGLGCTTPIYLCEGNLPYDSLALKRTPGIDPNLVAGIPCVLGGRVMLWLPNVHTLGSPYERYRLQPIWRIRNLYDHRNSADHVPYHLAKQGLGFPELHVNPGVRVVIPAAFDSVIYQQTEPAALLPLTPTAVSTVVENAAETKLILLAPPIMPNGQRGAVSQGVDASTVAGFDLSPRWVPYELQAEGDELVLCYYRTATYGNTWDFANPAGVDRPFAEVFGKNSLGVEHPDLGIYVTFGISP